MALCKAERGAFNRETALFPWFLLKVRCEEVFLEINIEKAKNHTPKCQTDSLLLNGTLFKSLYAP